MISSTLEIKSKEFIRILNSVYHHRLHESFRELVEHPRDSRLSRFSLPCAICCVLGPLLCSRLKRDRCDWMEHIEYVHMCNRLCTYRSILRMRANKKKAVKRRYDRSPDFAETGHLFRQNETVMQKSTRRSCAREDIGSSSPRCGPREASPPTEQSRMNLWSLASLLARRTSDQINASH